MLDQLSVFESTAADLEPDTDREPEETDENTGDDEAEATDENTGDDEPENEGGAREPPTTPDIVPVRQLRPRPRRPPKRCRVYRAAD